MSHRRVAFAVMIAALGAGCGGADVEDDLDRLLRTRADEVAPKSERIENVSAKARRGEEEHAFRVILRSGRCYVVAAAGEPGVRTIDLRVFDALGADAAKDKSPQPLVEVCANLSGPYRVVVDVTGRGRVRTAVFAKPEAKPAASAQPTASARDTEPKAPSDKTVRP